MLLKREFLRVQSSQRGFVSFSEMNSDSSCFSRSMSVQLVVMLQIKKGDVIMSAHPFVTSCPQAVLRHRNIFFFWTLLLPHLQGQRSVHHPCIRQMLSVRWSLFHPPWASFWECAKVTFEMVMWRIRSYLWCFIICSFLKTRSDSWTGEHICS